MRQSLIMGNWKMNGNRDSSKALCEAIIAGLGDSTKASIAVCVPSVYLSDLQALTSNSPLALGAQNVADQESGAYTGEVSAAMLFTDTVQYEWERLHRADNELLAVFQEFCELLSL